jgi:hypothetical protein
MYDIAVITAARRFIQSLAGATGLTDPAAAMAIAEAQAPDAAAIAADSDPADWRRGIPLAEQLTQRRPEA